MKYTSRRSFLSSLAILSAGAGLASVPGFKLGEFSASELQQLWTDFCRANNGSKMPGKLSFMKEALPAHCNGHFYKTGDAMRFSSNLIAVPVWVYWSNNQGKAADLLVTFFENGATPKKMIRINRFELEALALETAKGSKTRIESLLADICGTNQADTRTAKKVKTSITKDGKAHIASPFNGYQTTLSNTFFNI